MADESIILKDMKDVYNGWMREEEMAIKNIGVADSDG